MATLANNLNAAFLSVGKTVKTSSGSAVNIAICLVTVGSEQLFSFATFDCPCPRPITSNSSQAAVDGTTEGAMIYGLVYMIVPAIILFLLGFAMNIKTWKLLTGCGKRDQEASRGYIAGCKTLMEIFMQALVAPSAWVSIAFLDGKYYACALTKQPYVLSCEKMAAAVKKIILYTVEFEQHRRKSQVIGWVFMAIVVLVGSIIYLLYRCLSPLTYYHRKYMKWYREIEHAEMETIAKEQLKEQARENIKRFLSCKRPKHPWDHISTVYTFIRDEEGFALYSRLDQWNEDNPTSSEDSDSEDEEEQDVESNAIISEVDIQPNTERNLKSGQKSSSKFAALTELAMKDIKQHRTHINTGPQLPCDELYYDESTTKYATCRTNQQIAKKKSAARYKNTANSGSQNKLAKESSVKRPLLSDDKMTTTC